MQSQKKDPLQQHLGANHTTTVILPLNQTPCLLTTISLCTSSFSFPLPLLFPWLPSVTVTTGQPTDTQWQIKLMHILKASHRHAQTHRQFHADMKAHTLHACIQILGNYPFHHTVYITCTHTQINKKRNIKRTRANVKTEAYTQSFECHIQCVQTEQTRWILTVCPLCVGWLDD